MTETPLALVLVLVLVRAAVRWRVLLVADAVLSVKKGRRRQVLAGVLVLRLGTNVLVRRDLALAVLRPALVPEPELELELVAGRR